MRERVREGARWWWGEGERKKEGKKEGREEGRREGRKEGRKGGRERETVNGVASRLASLLAMGCQRILRLNLGMDLSVVVLRTYLLLFVKYLLYARYLLGTEHTLFHLTLKTAYIFLDENTEA